MPEFYEERDSFKVVFRNSCEPQNSDIYNKILSYCNEPKSAQEIRDYIGIKSKRYVAINYIKPLIDKGLLEYTNKNNINVTFFLILLSISELW